MPTAPAALAPEVWDAVRVLTQRQRTAIALRYVLDLPEAEVAQMMGIARGTASATLATARRHLGHLLVDELDPDEPELEEVCDG